MTAADAETMSHERSLLAVRVSVVILCIAIVIAFVGYEWNARSALHQNAERNVLAQSGYLLQAAQDTFEMADSILVSLANRLHGMPRTPIAIWSVNQSLERQILQFDRIETVAAYDENGEQFISSRSRSSNWSIRGEIPNLGWHLQYGGTAPRIGAPIWNPVSSEWSIPLTRRLTKLDGSFGGILLVTVEGSYFAALQERMERQENETVSLIGPDGVLLARHPIGEGRIGRRYEVPGQIRIGQAELRGTFQMQSPVDGVSRIYGYAIGTRYPLIQYVSVDRSALLSVWYREALTHLVAVLAALGAIVLVGGRLSQQFRYRQKSEHELHRLARTDALTGVANRRAFDEALGRVLTRPSAANAAPVSLLLLDVDHFKAFNDTYGHQAGDRCLAMLAAVMRSTVHRDADLVARYGGEEFAILLPETGDDDAVTLAERVRISVRTLGIPHSAHPEGIVTVSIGCSTRHPGSDLGPETMVRLADRALYQAKLLGRDRVEGSALKLVARTA